MARGVIDQAVSLCFILDLPSLSPDILRDWKQLLLQLGNYYQLLSSLNSFGTSCVNLDPLPNRIGLCYITRNLVSRSELKIAYDPNYGNFNLPEFHRALNNLPDDAFCIECADGALYHADVKLADILSETIVHSWASQDTNVAKKVILVSSVLGALDHGTCKALKDAAGICVKVEFIYLKQPSRSNSLIDVNENNYNSFPSPNRPLRNYSFWTCPPGVQAWYSLMRRWFLDIMGGKRSLQTRIIIRNNLMITQNEISCNLGASFNPIVDKFNSCQICRCHGIRLDQSNMNEGQSACPVTNFDLEPSDIIENSVRVGEQAILHTSSVQDILKLEEAPSPIFQITSLGSPCEGLITGETYLVTPYNSELSQLLPGILGVLKSMSFKQGLVCSSICNIGTERGITYNIFLPLEMGRTVLRKLSGEDDRRSAVPHEDDLLGALAPLVHYPLLNNPTAPPWAFSRTRFLQVILFISWIIFAVGGSALGEIITADHPMEDPCKACSIPAPAPTPAPGPTPNPGWHIDWMAVGFLLGLVLYIPFIVLVLLGSMIPHSIRRCLPFVKVIFSQFLGVGGMVIGQFLTAGICLKGYDRYKDVCVCCLALAYVFLFLTGGLKLANNLGTVGGFIGVCTPFLLRYQHNPLWLWLAPIPFILFFWPIIERVCVIDDVDIAKNLTSILSPSQSRILTASFKAIRERLTAFFRTVSGFFQAVLNIRDV